MKTIACRCIIRRHERFHPIIRWLLTGLVSLFLIAGLWSAVSTLGPTADPWEPHVTAAVGAYDRGDRAEGEQRLRARGRRGRSIPGPATEPGSRPGWLGRPAAGSIRPWLKSFARPPPGCAKTGRDPTSRAARRAPDLLDQLLLLYADGLFRVAGHYLRGGMVAEAEPLLKRVLFIRERLLGPQHPDAARAFDAYAEALASTNRRAQPD